MKKNTLIFSTALVLVSLLFFSFKNWNSTPINEAQVINKELPDLYYGVGPRFATINKTKLDKSTSIYDFLNEGEKNQIDQFESVEIVVIKDERQTAISAFGKHENLTNAQLKLLRSLDYFNHFAIRTHFKGKNKDTGKLEDRFFNPHITIVPDHQATYENGEKALINYFKEKSSEAVSIIRGDNLGAVMLYFTVTKDGLISNIYQKRMSTGYPSIDEKFKQLIKNIPGKWSPAENDKGEKIDQELVFTFGPANGC
ncbi:energy transducer TonB [Psychroserpens sp.]|uniref:energy transducer TonB n=1 Tax=Psychroserpens sp. TaxID=2020870 RepID=UPI00385EAD92